MTRFRRDHHDLPRGNMGCVRSSVKNPVSPLFTFVVAWSRIFWSTSVIDVDTLVFLLV